jgi:intracellular septation protein A
MFRLFRIELENFDQSISITIDQAITVPQQLWIRYLKMYTSLYDIFCGNLNSLLKYLNTTRTLCD